MEKRIGIHSDVLVELSSLSFEIPWMHGSNKLVVKMYFFSYVNLDLYDKEGKDIRVGI